MLYAFISVSRNNPSQHPELVDKLQKSVKLLTKNTQKVLKDLAREYAVKLKETQPLPVYYSLHCKEADPDYMNTFVRELGGSTNTFLFLSTGDDKETGNILLHGLEKDVADLGPK